MSAILQTFLNAIKDMRYLISLYFLYSWVEKVIASPTDENPTLTIMLVNVVMTVCSLVLMLLVSHQVQRNILASVDDLSQSPRLRGFGRYALRSLGFGCAFLLCMVPFFIVGVTLSSAEMIQPDIVLDGSLTGTSVTIFILVVLTLVIVRLGPWITAAVDPKAPDWVFTWLHPANKVFFPLLGLFTLSQVFHIASHNLVAPEDMTTTGLVNLVLLSCLDVFVLVGINVLITQAYIAMVKTGQTL
jgi:hypothetical protein